MKKIISVLACILLIALLSGCIKVAVQTEQTKEQTEASPVSDEATDALTEAEETEPETTEAETQQGSDYVSGVIEDKSYINGQINLKFNLPDGWSFASDSEVSSTIDSAKEYLDDNAKKLAEGSTVVEMLAHDAMSLLYTSVGVTAYEMSQIAGFDEKASLKAGLKSLKSNYKNLGYSAGQTKIEETQFAGQEHYIARAEFTSGEFSLHVSVLYIRKDNRVYNITTISSYADFSEEILSYYEALE